MVYSRSVAGDSDRDHEMTEVIEKWQKKFTKKYILTDTVNAASIFLRRTVKTRVTNALRTLSMHIRTNLLISKRRARDRSPYKGSFLFAD